MNNGCKLTKSPHKPKVSTKQHPQSQPQPQSQLQSQLQSQSQPQLQLQSQSQPQPQQKFVPVSPISARILPSTPIITFRGMILSPLRSRLYDIPPNHECRKTTNAYCLLNKDFHGASNSIVNYHSMSPTFSHSCPLDYYHNSDDLIPDKIQGQGQELITCDSEKNIKSDKIQGQDKIICESEKIQSQNLITCNSEKIQEQDKIICESEKIQGQKEINCESETIQEPEQKKDNTLNDRDILSTESSRYFNQVDVRDLPDPSLDTPISNKKDLSLINLPTNTTRCIIM